MAQEVEDDYVQGHLHWNQIHVTEHQITLSVFYEKSQRERVHAWNCGLGTVLSATPKGWVLC